jgi:S-adenosylmethionine hydrolase
VIVDRRIVTLLTDFGSRDAFVGVMKGVMLGIDPALTFVDLSHEIPPQDIFAGALLLRGATPFFPPGTIHLAVVDPGVGSSRRPLLVETRDAIFIGPDNGLLSLAAPMNSLVRIIHLTNAQFFLPRRSHTFHGRDVFAPVAAHVAHGVAPLRCGVAVPTMEQLSLPPVARQPNGLVGRVIYIDHFGNVVTNIAEADLRPFSKESLLVSINPVQIDGVNATYAAVEIDAPVAVINSWGMLEVAVRNGSAAQRFAVQVGQRVQCVVTEEQQD